MNFRKVIYLVLLVLPFYATGQNDGFRIDVQITGWENKKVYFEYHYGKKNILIDSLLLDNLGEIIIEGDTAMPDGIYMIGMPQKPFIEFIMDKNNQFFSLSTDTIDIVNHLKFKDSYDNEVFLSFQRNSHLNWTQNRWYRKRLRNNRNNTDSINEINAEIKEFNKSQKEFRKELIARNKNLLLAKIITSLETPIIPDPPIDTSLSPEAQKKAARMWKYLYYKDHYWDNIDFSYAGLLRTTLIENKINSFFTRVVPNTNDSIIVESERLIEKSKANPEVYRFVADKLLSNFEPTGKWSNDKVFVTLANKYFLSGQAPWVDSLSMQQLIFRVKMVLPTLLGKHIPITVFTTMDNTKNFTIDTIPAKIMILYFWSSDCSHCKKYTPKLYEIYKRYKDKGLKVVAITATNNFDEWRQYVKEQNYTEWINGYYEGNYMKLLNLYNVYMTPHIFILDENKTIIQKDLDPRSLENIIKQHLK